MKLRLILTALTFPFLVTAQDYWQQEVNYKIEVSLDDAGHNLSGNESFEYINHSPDTLNYIWIHLWPNAYKNKETALYKQVASQPDLKEKLKTYTETGFIDGLEFKVNGKKAELSDNTENIDVAKLNLPQPLLPGKKIIITTPFHVKLPGYFSRLGHNGNYYMISQWYPKPAVYDRKGWHSFPYLDQGEFYSEFGSFDVSITVPTAYVVAATGNLMDEKELNAYKTSGKQNKLKIGELIKSETDPKKITKLLESVQLEKVSMNAYQSATKTLHFKESRIHDFAWFASKDFVVQYDTLKLNSGAIVDAFTFFDLSSASLWYASNDYLKDAVVHYSTWLGEYPYQSVKAVQGPKNQSSGGMEYPTITMITSPDADQERLDAVITHEVGHNWLYGMIASNERDHPWMDEGVNTYFQTRYESEKYRANSIFGDAIPKELKSKSVDEFQAIIYNAMNENIPMDEAIENISTAFPNRDSYGSVVYLKTAIWLFILESSKGRENIDQAFHAYFNKWKFKHPYPEDFKQTFSESLGGSIDDLYQLINHKGKLLQ